MIEAGLAILPALLRLSRCGQHRLYSLPGLSGFLFVTKITWARTSFVDSCLAPVKVLQSLFFFLASKIRLDKLLGLGQN